MPFIKGKKLDWIHKKDIKQYLNQYDDKGLPFVVANIVEELRILAGKDSQLAMILVELQNSANDDNIESFDNILEDLYIWADKNLVWLGI